MDAKSNLGNTALMRAAYWGRADIVSFLLDKGQYSHRHVHCKNQNMHIVLTTFFFTKFLLNFDHLR